MPEISDPTVVRAPEPSASDATVVRHPAASPPAASLVGAAPSATDETRVRTSTSAPQPIVSTGSAGFAEEVRLLLRRRLVMTHAVIGAAVGMITLCGLTGIAVLPMEAGLGRWGVGLPLIAFGQSVAGLVFLWRHPGASLATCRFIELSQFGMIGLAGGIARFVVLNTVAPDSPDPRYQTLLYRFDALVTNYPIVFSIVLYGVVIPNTRRRSLVGAGLLFAVPFVATFLAAVANPAVRPALTAVVPGSVVPLFLAGVIAVFSATRSNALQRQAFEAKREAQQLGAYTLKKKLGEGGMGEVWLAEHRLLKRPCAVKFIRAELAANPDTARRFEREVRAVTALTHFNTVRIFDYGSSEDGSFFYVMEYLDGPTLDRLVKEHGPLAPGRAIYLLRQLCCALSEAHSAGMVHRDLKPGNILVAALGGQNDVAKLLDFGLVQDHSATKSDDRITRAGTVLGTPTYMCPEQASGELVDPRGDVYSLGAVAFFMVAGRPPFEGTSVGKLLTAHLAQTAPDLRDLRPEVPNDLAAVVAKCLLKDPKDRFQSMCEMESALAACACSSEWNPVAATRWWASVSSPGSAAVSTPAPVSDRTSTLVRS